MPTYTLDTPKFVPGDPLDQAGAEDGDRDEAVAENLPAPPPLSPEHAAAMPPVVPTVPDRVLPHLKARDLRSRAPVCLQKTVSLFGLIVKHGAHTMPDRKGEHEGCVDRSCRGRLSQRRHPAQPSRRPQDL